jgi:SulP family sulfate permease
MLRHEPPSRPSQSEDDGRHDKNSHHTDDDVEQERLIITPNGVRVDATERTPLISKDPAFESHHPDWIGGHHDIEGQDIRREPSWSKLRKVMLWPQEKGVDFARTIINPKRWNRQAIWQDAVVAPVSCLPAVILGLLLNILDALSYGMFYFQFPDAVYP